MEYNEEQEKEYISRESLNRLCKEAQELRWYKRYRSGASKAWLASCYIGGAAAAGGVGTIIGAVVGAFVMGILNNGMSLIGWSTDIQKVVKGAVLLGAVTFDIVSQRKKS